MRGRRDRRRVGQRSDGRMKEGKEGGRKGQRNEEMEVNGWEGGKKLNLIVMYIHTFAYIEREKHPSELMIQTWRKPATEK